MLMFSQNGVNLIAHQEHIKMISEYNLAFKFSKKMAESKHIIMVY